MSLQQSLQQVDELAQEMLPWHVASCFSVFLLFIPYEKHTVLDVCLV